MTLRLVVPDAEKAASIADARRMLVGLAAATRIRRRDLGISQEALSRRCGFGRHYVGAIEREEAAVDLRSLAALAQGLGYDCLLDLLIRASMVAASIEAAMNESAGGGGSNGRSR